jgi:threonine synthase
MDISKASNFERYIADLVARDGKRLSDLWQQVETRGEFNLRGDQCESAIAATGFVSGSSTHRHRVETIRHVFHRYGVMIDTHTADGVKVGLEHREPGVPLVCLETALPAKFAETIREALGREPERPRGFEALEQLPQRVTVIDPDPGQVKAFIAAHALA